MGWTIRDYKLKSGDSFTYIEVDGVDGELEKSIDRYIARICYGSKFFSKEAAKKDIHRFIENVAITRKEGAISEFILHVYLNSVRYRQASLYENLEEDSPKKGFDGVYVKKRKTWYVESKSGLESTANHRDKVEEAYRDIDKKFRGLGPNNPWRNAYNHAMVAKASGSLKKAFAKLSEEYSNGIYHDIGEYRIMPCGTIFTDLGITTFSPARINSDLSAYFVGKRRKGLHVICVTVIDIEDFERYFGA